VFYGHDFADVGVVGFEHVVKDASYVGDFVCGESSSELSDGIAGIVDKGIYAIFALLIAS